MPDQAPEDMVVVSKQEFFELLYANKRDIMPNNNRRESTDWTTPARSVWGWSTPGWASPYGTASSYAVSRLALAQGCEGRLCIVAGRLLRPRRSA